MLQWQRECYAGLVECHAGILAESGDYEAKSESERLYYKQQKGEKKID